ncbi:beta-ketoacyl reductase, partial [Micromonospora sp. D75]|uniref:beta-ketoacyl reductase n=1 Tax=Micromonospora sp. D75 TaxID=2824885 RepID=UPI001B36E57E
LAALTAGAAAVHLLTVDPATATRDGLAADLDRLATAHQPTALLSLLALDEAPHPEQTALPTGLAANLLLVQAHTGRSGPAVPLWLATTGAVAVDGEAVAHPAQATTWGLGLVAALEHPRHVGGVVDLPAGPAEAAYAALVGALVNVDGEDQLAVREDGVHTRRLVRDTGLPAVGDGYRPNGTVLLTGGTGALARHTTDWLGRHGAEVLPLAEPATGKLGDLMEQLAAEERSVTALVHVPAETGSVPLAELTLAGLAADLAATVGDVPRYADELAHRPLDAFVLCTSTTGVWGAGGRAGQSAGDALLHALAANRRHGGLAATAVAWGPWSDDPESPEQAQLRRRGLPGLPPELALEAFGQALRAEAGLIVADVRWDRFVPTFASMRPCPLLTGVPEAGAAMPADDERQPADDEAATALRERLRPLSPAEREGVLVDLVGGLAATVLGHGGD